MEPSIIIPAKDEAGSIARVVEGVFSNVPGAEIIVVDDGSKDDTAHLARMAGAKVVSHRYSKGNGAAIKTGARAATRSVLVFMDADGQHDPKDINKLITKLEEGYSLVVGSRSRGAQASTGRSMANKFYNRLATYITGQPVKDLTSGFRAAQAEEFQQFLYLLPNGFSYPTTSTMAFFRAGYSVAYVPIDVSARTGKSHIKPFQDGLRFLLIIFKIGTLYSPLKLFVPISFAVFLVGVSYYGYTFFTAGRFTNMSALMLTTSLIIFMVGLVSEQITALMYKNSG